MITTKRFNEYAADPAAFRADLIVDVNGEPKRFGDVMDDWQRDDFALLDPALRACNGRGKPGDARMRAYLERPRGHSKTTDLAVTVVWALAFANRPVRGFAYAADRDQAALLKQAVETLCRLNPWLATILTVEANRVVNKARQHPGEGGTLTIEASDVGSSYGILPDLIIADELTHWDGDGSLWHSLISSAAKRSNCLLVVISNAGFMESWQWAVREAARTEGEREDGSWHFRRIDGPVASWMTEERLDEQRRMLPGIAFDRLWMNLWSAAGGDALSPEVIDAAFRDDLDPLTSAQPGWDYVAGLDLGLVRDASAFVVIGVRRTYEAHGAVRLVHVKLWRPSRGRKVPLDEVESHCAAMHDRFRLRSLGYDSWQAAHLASRLQAGHVAVQRKQMTKAGITNKVPMVEVPPTGPNLQRMASTLIEAFNDHRVELYEHPDLRRDLTRFRVEEKQYGFRLTSPRDGHGHGDTGSAFAIALLAAMELANKRKFSVGTLDGRGGTPLDRAFARIDSENERLRELAAMPDDDPIRDLMKRVGRI